MDHVHSRGKVSYYVRAVFEPDFDQLEAECNRKVFQTFADHVACDHVVPDNGHMISDQRLGHVACGCAQVISAQDYDPAGLDNAHVPSEVEVDHVVLDSSHKISEKVEGHVLSDTNHALFEPDFGHVIYKNSVLESGLVPGLEDKFFDLDSGHPVFGNYQVILDTGCEDLDQHHVQAAADSDLFCSLEEEVSDSGRVVFPKALVARMECDTARAPQRDHVESVAEYYWSYLR